MAAFLKNLFTPKWQHSDSKVRLNALDQTIEPEILAQIASEDTDNAVRLKAISLIENPKTLQTFFNQKDGNIKHAAIERFLTTTLNSDQADSRLENLSKIDEPAVLMSIATYSSNQDLAQAAIAKIQDENTLFDFILQSPSAKSRALAAQLITSKDKLKTIEQRFLNKDKNLVRLAKTKLTDISAEEASTQAKQAHIDKLLNDIQSLTTQAFSPTYAGQLAFLKQSWEKVDGSMVQSELFAKNIKLCEAVLTEQQAIQNKLNADLAAKSQAQELQLNCINSLETFTLECKSTTPSLNSVNSLISQANEQWQQALELKQPLEPQIKKEFESLLKPLVNLQASLGFIEDTSIDFKPLHASLENKVFHELKEQKSQLNSIIKSINWPNEFPKNKLLNSYATLLSEVNAALDSLNKDEKQVIQALNQLLEQLEKAINDGQVKQAKNIQNTIRKQLDQLAPNKIKPQKAQLQLLTQSLNNLKDWQGFATLPKFEALCDSMNGLIEAQMPAKEKAKAIHELQEQWKALGSLPNQKQQQALWQTFKKASDKAYLPCQSHFEEMGKIRQYNLEQRTIICEQLEQFFTKNDWHNPNWKSVQQILDKAHDEFKTFSPVDHVAKKDILQRFHEATQAIHAKLVEHFKDNASQKQALIDEVTALKDSEDIAQAIEDCKNIQNQWKTKGNAGRAERQLWSQFREQCDALFEKRNAASEARKQRLDSNIEQANQLVTNIESQLEENPQHLKKQLNETNQQLTQIELPKKVKIAIDKRLAELNNKIELAAKQSKAKAQHSLWLNAQDLAKQLSQVEQSSDQENSFTVDVSSAAIPTEVKNIFTQRLSNQVEPSEDTFHKLCLELEITLDIESPKQDQGLRMALQVERLQKNMGQKLPTIEEQLRALQCRWFTLNADNSEYSALHDRFFGSLNNRYESIS
ncbi:hypothetical protein NBRC116188_16710 [Oceaniserpentilla sp. 4NH20-0058]|uniref:DUF349 domain-containing protein n=1 Tax=Oceaniserpentilla sp. 4NH20-0058 TaxID=3127660 RepID=UPI0031086A8B